MRLKVMNMKNLFMIIVIIVLSTGSLYAGDTRYNENMHTPQDVWGGTAVSPQTGSLSLSFTDFTLPGMNGMDFSVSRAYSSTLGNIYNMAVDDKGRSYVTPHTPGDWKYGLGTGWTFSWPFIYQDINDRSAIRKLSLFWGGNVYELDQSFSSDKNENNIKYYYVNNFRVYLDSSVVYENDYVDEGVGQLNNLGVRSRYCLELKDRTKYYFSEAGNLMVIQKPMDENDIKQAEIWFYYKDHRKVENPEDYEEYRDDAKIELVVDSVGREIDFVYKQGEENWLEEIKYRVEIRGEDVERKIGYVHRNLSEYVIKKIDSERKELVEIDASIGTGDRKYVLSRFINQMGHENRYEYGVYEGEFSFYPGYGNGKNYHALLEKVYQHYTEDTSEGAKYKCGKVYEYNSPEGNYIEYARNFAGGFMEIFKITRQYMLNKRGEEYKDTRYEYYGNSYGKKMSEYWTIMKTGGLEAKHVFAQNDVETEDNLLTYVETEGNGGEFLERVDYVYDVRKTLKEKSMYRGGLLKHTEEYIYDKWNDLINHKAPNGLVTETRYDEDFHLPVYSIQRGIKNGDGSFYDIEKRNEIRKRDGKILSESVRNTLGDEKVWIKNWEYTYDGYGNIVEAKDALGRVVKTKYDEEYHIFPEETSMDVTLDGVLTEVKGYKLFNTDGSIWIEADNDGRATEHIYDETGTEIMTILPDEDDLTGINTAEDLRSEEWKASRSNNSFVNMEVNYQEESVITYGEEFNGLRMKSEEISDGLGNIEAEVLYEYDEVSGEYTEYSARKMLYDSRGNMIALTDPDAGDVYIRRKIMDKVVEVYNKTWLVWYDDLNRMKKVEYPDEGSRVVKKEIHYDDVNLTVTTINTKGTNTIEEYDIDKNLIKVKRTSIEDYSGEVHDVVYEFDYNQVKQKIGFQDPLGEEVRYKYDERGFMVEQDYGSGKDEMVYDNTGNLISKTDRNGSLIKFYYDELNRCIKEEYYRSDNLDEAYDVLDMGYDGRGNLISVNGKELIEEMEYDSRSRIKKIERMYVSESLRKELRERLDWVDSEELGEQKFGFEYTYTPNDLIDEMILPNGKVVKYGYEEDKLRLNRIEMAVNGNLKDIVTNVEYYSGGLVMKMGYGNNTEQKWEFDVRNRIKSTEVNNGQENIFRLEYDIDTEGNITRINENRFGYDELDRLIKSEIVRLGEVDYLTKVKDAFGTSLEEPFAGEREYDEEADLNEDGYVNGYDHIQACQEWREKYDRETFSYDHNGNRRVLIQNGKEYVYTYGERNRLLKIEKGERPVLEYEYDNNGNTVKRVEYNENGNKVEYTFEYDIHNRLESLKKDGEEYSRYIYDNSGLRMYKEEQGRRTYYFRNGATVLFEVEIEGEKTTEHSYIASGELIAGRITRENGNEEEVRYYHLDHLNSTKAVTDESGETVLMYEYRAFGSELDKMGDDANRYSYIGREFDEEINLYYMNARYYDATIGRFINVDPVQDGYNWYVYADNNPLKKKDPSGLQDKEYYFRLGSASPTNRGSGEVAEATYLGFPDVGHTWVELIVVEVVGPGYRSVVSRTAYDISNTSGNIFEGKSVPGELTDSSHGSITRFGTQAFNHTDSLIKIGDATLLQTEITESEYNDLLNVINDMQTKFSTGEYQYNLANGAIHHGAEEPINCTRGSLMIINAKLPSTYHSSTGPLSIAEKYFSGLNTSETFTQWNISSALGTTLHPGVELHKSIWNRNLHKLTTPNPYEMRERMESWHKSHYP